MGDNFCGGLVYGLCFCVSDLILMNDKTIKAFVKFRCRQHCGELAKTISLSDIRQLLHHLYSYNVPQ